MMSGFSIQLANRSQYDANVSLNFASLGSGIRGSIGYCIHNGINGVNNLDWWVGLN